jgi:tripartite-type tricarboxylate transporter receptor subunit TctC
MRPHMPAPRKTATMKSMPASELLPWRWLLAVVLAIVWAWWPGAGAATDFYAGKTINLYIGYGPGGGYDTYGRLVARHLGHHLAGSPLVVPQNMPGAGGFKVANYLYQVAPQDGTALALAAEAVALEQTLGGPGIEYDASRLNWIGRMASTASIFFTWHTSAVKNIEDARKFESAFGSTGITGITGYTPRALNKLAGTRFKVVTGYNGSADVMLAMERGEIDGGFALWPEFKNQKPDWLSGNKINILYLVAAQRAPDLPAVPTTGELGKTAEGRDVLRLLGSTTEVGRALFGTRDEPAERTAELRAAFAKMVQDPAFLQDADKSGLRIDAMSGEDLQKAVAAVTSAPKNLVEKAKEARE